MQSLAVTAVAKSRMQTSLLRGIGSGTLLIWSTSGRPACGASGRFIPNRSRAQIGQHRQHAPVVVTRGFKLQLHEDAAHMGLDGLGAEVESSSDRRVGATLSHDVEHRTLPLGEL